MGRRKPDSREPTLRFRFTPPPPTPPEVRKPRRRRLRWLRLLVVAFLLFLLALVSAFFGFVTAIAQDLPKLDQYEEPELAQLGGIWAKSKKGEWVKIATLRSPEARILVKPNQIDEDLRNAVVAIEDKRFFDHKGVDPTAILRALVNKWSSGSEEGGSTITQQLIKNTLVGDEHSYQRKLKEAALAYQLEKRWSKEKILAEYLNTIYFGHGNYGVETAARYYFGKGSNNLEAEEAALLAAIPKAPSEYDPVEHPAAARQRRNLVIDEMVDQGYLSPEAGLVAKSRRLLPEDRRPGLRTSTASSRTSSTTSSSSSSASTASAPSPAASRSTRRSTSRSRRRRRSRSPRRSRARGRTARWSRSSRAPARCGRWWPDRTTRRASSTSRRAASASRAPPSSRSCSWPASRTASRPARASPPPSELFDLGNRQVWYVTNYTKTYAGSISLKDATIASDNTVYAQLTMTVGPAKVAAMARKLGITSPLDEGVPAIGLGGLRVGVTPLEMAHAYATIANEGVRMGGSVLFHAADAPIQDPTLDPITIERIRIPGEKDVVNTPTARRVVSRRRTPSPPSTRCAGCSRLAPASARTSAGPPRARRARPATTRTRGSPASRRSAPAAVWVGPRAPGARDGHRSSRAIRSAAARTRPWPGSRS